MGKYTENKKNKFGKSENTDLLLMFTIWPAQQIKHNPTLASMLLKGYKWLYPQRLNKKINYHTGSIYRTIPNIYKAILIFRHYGKELN
jgi:hypothetical protein